MANRKRKPEELLTADNWTFNELDDTFQDPDSIYSGNGYMGNVMTGYSRQSELDISSTQQFRGINNNNNNNLSYNSSNNNLNGMHSISTLGNVSNSNGMYYNSNNNFSNSRSSLMDPILDQSIGTHLSHINANPQLQQYPQHQQIQPHHQQSHQMQQHQQYQQYQNQNQQQQQQQYQLHQQHQQLQRQQQQQLQSHQLQNHQLQLQMQQSDLNQDQNQDQLQDTIQDQLQDPDQWQFLNQKQFYLPPPQFESQKDFNDLNENKALQKFEIIHDPLQDTNFQSSIPLQPQTQLSNAHSVHPQTTGILPAQSQVMINPATTQTEKGKTQKPRARATKKQKQEPTNIGIKNTEISTTSPQIFANTPNPSNVISTQLIQPSISTSNNSNEDSQRTENLALVGGSDCIGNQFFVKRAINEPKEEKTMLILCSKVAQKSYGNEKRFFCPPPAILMNGSWRNDSLIRIGIEEDGKDSQQANLDANGIAVFKNLYISDSDKRKNFTLYLRAAHPNGRDFGVFRSKPIKVISKPSKKKQSVKNVDLCINSGNSVAFFNRIRSQTVSTKYLCVENGGFVARSSIWDAFVITASGKTLVPGEDMNLHYGMEIVLQSTLTNLSSPELIVRKVEKNDVLMNCDEPISQLHKVALQVKDSDKGYLAVSSDNVILEKATIGPNSTETITDSASWTLVGTDSVKYSFFDFTTTNKPVTPAPVVEYVKVQNKTLVELYGENFHPNLTVWFQDTPARTKYRCEDFIICEPPLYSSIVEGETHCTKTLEVPLFLVRTDGIVFSTPHKYTYHPEPIPSIFKQNTNIF